MEFDTVFFSNGKHVYTQPAGGMGSGVFAADYFDAGETLLTLKIDDEYSEILPWAESFGSCFEYGITLVPGFAFCPKPTHPFRYINHSCNPNCGFIHWGTPVDEVYLPIIAYKPILPHTQLFLDYALITAPNEGSPAGDPWKMLCLCGESNCRKVISGFDTLPQPEQLHILLRDIKGMPGMVLAHMLDGRDDLLAEFARLSPELFADFLRALEYQKECARRLADAIRV